MNKTLRITMSLSAVCGLAHAANIAPPAAAPPAVEPERAVLTGAVVIDSSLRLISTDVAVLDDERLVLIDDDGRRTVLDAAAVLAVIRRDELPEGFAGVLRTAEEVLLAAQQPEVATADGERYPGVFMPRRDGENAGDEKDDGSREPDSVDPAAGSADEGSSGGDSGGDSGGGDPAETVYWNHLRFRTLAFPIERVAYLHRSGEHGAGIGPGAPPREDVLVLQNGDRRTGLMLSVGEPMAIESDGAELEVDSARVRSLALANPRGPLTGAAVWMEDGTVARVAQVRLTPPRGVWLRRAEGQTAQYDAAALLAWCRDSSCITPLSAIEPVSQAPTGDRPRTEPVLRVLLTRDRTPKFGVALDAWDLELPGPMSVEYEVPEGTARLVGSARLAPGCDPWGDCELVIRSAGVEVLRQRLRAGEDAVSFSVPLRGRSLTVETVAGEYGAVQDRVVLVRPLVLSAP